MAGHYSSTVICHQCLQSFCVVPSRARKNKRHFCSETCRLAYHADHMLRFWERVRIGSFKECWPWQGSTMANGYGQVRIDKQCWLVHRVAFNFMWHDLADDILVLHHCDNPPCCNPWHLFDGTHQDNVDDKMNKGRYRHGRHLYGEDHPWSKLPNRDVQKIIQLWNLGEHTRQELATMFFVTYQHIDHIVKKRERKYA